MSSEIEEVGYVSPQKVQRGNGTYPPLGKEYLTGEERNNVPRGTLSFSAKPPFFRASLLPQTEVREDNPKELAIHVLTGQTLHGLQNLVKLQTDEIQRDSLLNIVNESRKQ